MTDTPSQQLFDLWKKQVEEGTQAWSRMVGQASMPGADPAAFWRPAVEQWVQSWAKAFAQAPATPDVMAQWKQFLDQSIEAWSRALGQAMNTESFAQLLGKYLDQWLTAYGPVKKATDQAVEGAWQAVNLPSRAQVIGLARQIVELDERVERIEDGVSAVLRRLDEVARLIGPPGAGARETTAKERG